jgi:Chalcone isomerase-like
MHKFWILSTVLMTFVLSTNAQVLSRTLGTNEIAGVKLAKSADAKINGANVSLTEIGAGLRQKKVLIANVKVYVAELFSSEPVKMDKASDKVLNALASMNTVAMQLTFMRNVEAEKVQVSFRDALTANKVNIDDPAIKQLLDYVVKGGEAKEGKTLTFLAFKNSDGTDSLSYETNDGVVSTVKGKDLIKNVFSMWLGEPADDGLKKLKEDLLK